VAYITRLPEQFQNYHRWTYIDDQVGWIASLDKGLLERVITQKAKKLVKYRSQISDVKAADCKQSDLQLPQGIVDK
jgi:hypothetical protein